MPSIVLEISACPPPLKKQRHHRQRGQHHLRHQRRNRCRRSAGWESKLFTNSGFGKWFWKGCKPNSVCALRRRESFVWAADTRNLSAFTERGTSRSSVSYLALHPMGFSVPRRLRFARWSLTPPFHPCRRFLRNTGGLIFCGTVRRKVFQLPARVYPNRTDLGYAASRPMVFGLSSSGSRRKRFSALPKPVGK